jgi:hypothetical protein
MLCPSCQTAILDAPERCPACGESLSLAEPPMPATSTLTEAIASPAKSGKSGNAGALSSHGRSQSAAVGEEISGGPTTLPPPRGSGRSPDAERGAGGEANAKSGKNGNSARLDEAAAEHVTALVVAGPEPAPAPLIKRLPELTALAWRQPIVRAAVKTGAGAITLSLALSLARRALVRSAARAASPTLPSLLMETLGQRERPRARRPRRGDERDIMIEEVYIYARRVTRG